MPARNAGDDDSTSKVRGQKKQGYRIGARRKGKKKKGPLVPRHQTRLIKADRATHSSWNVPVEDSICQGGR